MTKTSTLFCWIFYCITQNISVIHAQSLGVVGEVFPVEEMSFLAFIEGRLQDPSVIASVKVFEEQSIDQVTKHTDRPQSLNLPRTSKTRQYAYVPQITLKNDIRDAEGHIIWRQGITVNALEHLPFYQPHWIFLDGDDVIQCRWVKHQLEQTIDVKIILTGGSVQKAATLFQHEIFFDQGGRIINQLGITHIPARVSRLGNELLIQEMALGEGSYEY